MNRPVSLTTRLTLLFGLILGCVLTVLSLFIFSSMRQHFIDQDNSVLSSHADELLELMSRQARSNQSDSIKERLDHTMSRHDLDFVVMDQQGNIFYQNAHNAIPKSVIENKSDTRPYNFTQWSENGVGHRAIVVDKDGIRLVVSMSTEAHDHFLNEFRERLVFVLLMMLIVTWGLSWVAVRRGLAPLNLLKERAAIINRENLDRYIPTDEVPAELVPLSRELNNMLKRLEEAFQRLVAFSSDLAHEMRTPVGNLLTQSQVALTQERSIEEYRNVLASNIEECERLSRMISEMLFLAKAENGNILPQKERVSLQDEVSKARDYFEALAESKGIVLRCHGEAQIAGDRSMVRRAISNLLSNAIHYGNANSTVSVDITQKSPWVILAVTNEGTEIPTEQLPHLFDRFYRVNSARTQDASEGLGLGLAITKAILKAHKGQVFVDSASGRHSFKLMFPEIEPLI